MKRPWDYSVLWGDVVVFAMLGLIAAYAIVGIFVEGFK